MNLWTVASIVMLAIIFWLNATIIATPYIAKLSGQATPLMNKKAGVITILLLSASLMYFMFIVGDLADAGLSGMFDPMYMEFIQTGPIGQFVLLQIGAAVLWLVVAVVGLPPIRVLAYMGAAALMSWSFLGMGHSAEAAWWAKLAFLIHLLAAWLWFGSLHGLRHLATSVPPAKARRIMETFGSHMSIAVPALIIAGMLMYRSATGQWIPALPFNSYTFVLAAKLLLVGLILVMAAIHKFKLVPQLDGALAAHRLKQSITVEMLLAVLIIMLAMTLSSGLSPR
ncbi:copper resistance D family protein [Aliidiomarina maris]|uniref:Copper-binding protein n=1 Tax=Aliidiomarina maris TaxID=531312 RepID=A0A327WUY6_9GAMM|nr:CopD family protein [Aliidiomarina maris]RAJ92910.1 putative copper resistance protein D [Aliidiomarina maris]RUO18186.1 copper-binding protein [Aliidiomarina maris]